MSYLLDANVFIQAKNLHYGLDFCPALAHGQVLVTHEKPDNSTKKIKIPVTCIGLDVKCMTPYERLRYERARFVLGREPSANDTEQQTIWDEMA